jgi:hypothetical protein
MICNMIFHGGAPECQVRQKINKNQLLVEENLDFVGCVVDAVEDVDVVDLLS